MRDHSERGNVLFLILIAVALFAALSYAITQSTRTGGGNAAREQSLIGSSALAQYPINLRSAVMRMVIGGENIRNILFNSPENFGALSANRLVFHPQGGGATYSDAPGDVMAAATSANWIYNAEFRVPNVGSDGTNGNDVIAFLVGVNQATCERINKQSGIAASTSAQCGTYRGEVPEVDLLNSKINLNMVNGYTFPSNTVVDPIQCTGGSASAFTAKSIGCFYDTNLNGGQFVFYSVISER